MSITLLNLSDLIWDQAIYPRAGINQKTIEAYVEALRLGAQFPPIKIRRVLNYPVNGRKQEAIIIVDGLHRFFAFKECGMKEIPAEGLDH
jgi:ParB-like chromosome segregation protein Spo0J